MCVNKKIVQRVKRRLIIGNIVTGLVGRRHIIIVIGSVRYFKFRRHGRIPKRVCPLFASVEDIHLFAELVKQILKQTFTRRRCKAVISGRRTYSRIIGVHRTRRGQVIFHRLIDDIVRSSLRAHGRMSGIVGRNGLYCAIIPLPVMICGNCGRIKNKNGLCRRRRMKNGKNTQQQNNRQRNGYKFIFHDRTLFSYMLFHYSKIYQKSQYNIEQKQTLCIQCGNRRLFAFLILRYGKNSRQSPV